MGFVPQLSQSGAEGLRLSSVNIGDRRSFLVTGVEGGSSGGHNWIDTLTSKMERRARKSQRSAVLDFASGLPQEGVVYCRRGSSPPLIPPVSPSQSCPEVSFC